MANLVKELCNFIIKDAQDHPTHEMLSCTKDIVQIHRFSGTKLSNFYPVWVGYNNTVYPSVEHGYQSQKFDIDELKSITQIQYDALVEMLKCKGCATHFPEHIASFFTDRNFSSGNIKMIVNKLQEYGYGVKNWNEIKMEVMVSLLLEKRQNDILSEYLYYTGNAYLVEGNTWHDNYRGYHDVNGKNYLGRALMYIRDNIIIKK